MRSAAEVLGAMLRIFESGDTSDLSMIGEDYLDHQGLSGMPLVGPEGFQQVVEQVQRSMPELVIDVRGETEFDDHVAATLRWTFSVDGHTTHHETLECLKVVDGQAAEHWGDRLAP